MSRIPQFRVDQSSFTLVGTKLYSGDLAAIWARETLQNSVDAGAKNITITYREARFETGTHGSLDFEGVLNGWTYSAGPKVVKLVCEDNGCGMDEDVLLDDFLRLGGSFKPGEDSVGGFGVAKSVILCGQRWHIHTGDLYLDASMMDKEPLRHIERRDGTRIEMRILLNESGYRWAFSAVRNALQLCDLPGVSIVLKHENEHGRVVSEEKIGRLRTGKQIDDIGWATVHTNSKRGKSFRGVHVRARGLWQFSKWVSGDVCVFVDIPRMPRPNDHDYPFTLSREGLITPYGVKVDEIVERLTVEPSKGRKARDLGEEIVDVWFPKPLPDEEMDEEPVRMVARVGGDDVPEVSGDVFEDILPKHGVWSPSVGTPNPISVHGERTDGVVGPTTLPSPMITSPDPVMASPFHPMIPVGGEEEFTPLVPFPFLVMKQRRYERRKPERHIPTMRTLSVFHSLMVDVMDIVGLSDEMDRDIVSGIVLSQDVVAAHMRHDDIQAIMISGDGIRWDDDPNVLMPRLLIRLSEEIVHSLGNMIHNEQMIYSTISMFDVLMRDHHKRLVEAVRRGKEEYETYSERRRRHLAGRSS